MAQLIKPVAITYLNSSNVLQLSYQKIFHNKKCNLVYLQTHSKRSLMRFTDQAAYEFIQMREDHNAALFPNLIIVVTEIFQVWQGKTRCHAFVYKTSTKRFKYSSNNFPIIYNF